MGPPFVISLIILEVYNFVWLYKNLPRPYSNLEMESYTLVNYPYIYTIHMISPGWSLIHLFLLYYTQELSVV